MRGLRRRVSILVLVVATGFGTARADELRGVALVIGQADYETLGDLGNPLNDARAMDELLGGLGFEVSRVLDRGGDRLRRAIADFVEDAENADVALVYYAGHAVEAGGQNFLVPVDADLATGNSLIAVSEIVDELARIVPVTILLLDACRTEAFPDGSMVLLPGSATPVAVAPTGLVEMRGPTPMLADVPPESLGMVIGFAAAPGQAALDGPAGGNSPYAAALLKHFSAGGYAFGDLMTLVTEEVYLRTGAKQVPWTNSSLRRVLSFGTPVETISGDEALIRDGR
ncbi:MAG: caspase family protein, partial [Alphaproteobacteria bacterium]|nr:caspase family protein [Alphaproteobacteria bacterium]